MLPEPIKANSSLIDEDLRIALVEELAKHLNMVTCGRLVNPTMVAEVLIYAATTGKSIHSVCEALLGVADGNTIREYINAHVTTDELTWLETAINQMLVSHLPRKVRRGRWKVACDTHDQPFYGKSPELRAWACRGKARDGTTWFFRIATCYVMTDGVRVTLAIRFLRSEDKLPAVLEGLLERARPHLKGIQMVFLDKAFASVEVMNLLDRAALSAIIACPIRGKKGGTRTLCGQWRNRTASHTFNNAKHGSKTVRVAIVHELHPEKEGSKCHQWLIYIQIRVLWSPSRVRDEYRRRFGIESSYRCLNQLRANTTTRNPALRFLFLGLALVLENAWVITRFLFCQVPRRGRAGRIIDEARFRLDRFKDFLRRAIERRRRPVEEIRASVLPLHGLSVNY